MTMDLAIEPPPTRRKPLLDKPLAALFDLDGTLIDSVPDITLAVAELLASEKLPALGEDQVRRMVGHGIRGLVRRVYNAQGIALDEDLLDQKTDAMLQVYPRYLTGRTVLMPGTREALDYLTDEGVLLAVVTNKPQAFAEVILEHFDLRGRFALILGDVPGQTFPRKPDPAMLLAALQGLDVTTSGAIMVGDSGVDIAAAKAARMRAVAVRGGYTNEPLETYLPDVLLDDLSGLRLAIEG
jgi:phosphoglycolate phosphatase